MVELTLVAVVSTAAWLLSVAFPGSAARRHLILSSGLAACLLAPAAFRVRADTDWTLLSFPTLPEHTQTRDTGLQSLERAVERSLSQRDSLMPRDSESPAPGESASLSESDGIVSNETAPADAREAVTGSSAGLTAPLAPGSTSTITRIWLTSAPGWIRIVYLSVAAVLPPRACRRQLHRCPPPAPPFTSDGHLRWWHSGSGSRRGRAPRRRLWAACDRPPSRIP